MSKLRKMLGRVDGEAAVALMHLIETQNKTTLAAWALDYAASRCLPVLEANAPGELLPREAVAACRRHLAGEIRLADLKPTLKAAREYAAAVEHPTAQAAARAIATACAVVQTPTNALGFLFYAAAAVAYDEAGLDASAERYDALAEDVLADALAALRAAAVADEPAPVKVNWGC